MGKKIRVMDIHDYQQSYELWSKTEGMGISEADSEVNIAFYLERNKGLSFVCEKEGQIIGTVLCGHDGRRGYIYHLAVHKTYRGMGISAELLDRSLSELKNVGIKKCHIFVKNDNEIGFNFWSHSDWELRDDFTVFSKNT